MAIVQKTVDFTLDGQTFQASQLTDKDHVELDCWVRKRYLDIQYAQLPANDADRKIAIQTAQEFASTLAWLSPHGAKLVATVEGMSKLVSVMIRQHHPTTSYDDVRRMLTSPAAVAEANRVFAMVNDFGGGGSKQATAKKPRSSRAKRSTR
jgi:hypothetical protein